RPAKWRHQNVADERGHDRRKRGADDDADGKVDHIAFDGKVPEFLPHAPTPFDLAGDRVESPIQCFHLSPTSPKPGNCSAAAPIALQRPPSACSKLETAIQIEVPHVSFPRSLVHTLQTEGPDPAEPHRHG